MYNSSPVTLQQDLLLDFYLSQTACIKKIEFKPKQLTHDCKESKDFIFIFIFWSDKPPKIQEFKFHFQQKDNNSIFKIENGATT